MSVPPTKHSVYRSTEPDSQPVTHSDFTPANNNRLQQIPPQSDSSPTSNALRPGAKIGLKCLPRTQSLASEAWKAPGPKKVSAHIGLWHGASARAVQFFMKLPCVIGMIQLFLPYVVSFLLMDRWTQFCIFHAHLYRCSCAFVWCCRILGPSLFFFFTNCSQH